MLALSFCFRWYLPAVCIWNYFLIIAIKSILWEGLERQNIQLNNLPCTQLTQVQSVASYMIPWAQTGEIPECRASPTKDPTRFYFNFTYSISVGLNHYMVFRCVAYDLTPLYTSWLAFKICNFFLLPDICFLLSLICSFPFSFLSNNHCSIVRIYEQVFLLIYLLNIYIILSEENHAVLVFIWLVSLGTITLRFILRKMESFFFVIRN